MTQQSARDKRRRYKEAAGWSLRNREGSLTADEQRNFDDWLSRDPENRAAYEAAQRLMGEARTAILSDPALRDFEVRPSRNVTKPVTAIALVAGLAGGIFVWQDGIMRLRADVMSGTGEMPIITLADGSIMQLNAYSAVAYDFTTTTRTIRLLRGEAFFQVAKDAERPFAVEAGAGRTTALGTAFNVRLGETETDVTVTEHAVSVAALQTDAPVVRVQQGQQAAYGVSGAVRDVRAVDASTALAWRRGRLVADNALLADVVSEIGRHFSGRIFIPSDALAGRRVSGTFSITDTVAALAFLEQSLGIKTIKIGPLIVIRE